MNRGFTLVELSIVLVILGLLVGGVLTGQTMIHAAELRSVEADVARYQAAVYTFRDKYFALPGDMTNATNYWGAAGGNSGDNYTATCYSTASTGTLTCNGNGDGQIYAYSGGSNYNNEEFRVWQHLANAGLVEGSYTGVQGASAPVVFGTNSPRSRISGAGYSLGWADNNIYGAFSPAAYGNNLYFGAASDVARAPILKPEDAYNIDKKMDDGNPSTGNVMAEYTESSCFTGSWPTATYTLTTTSIQCSFRFLMH